MDTANIIGIISVFALVFISAFFQFSAIIWTAFIGVGLIAITANGYLSLFPALLCWTVYLGAALFSNSHVWRQRTIIKPALSILKKQMPTISKTEREAIEAGNTWWEKELFCGRPQWKQLFSFPKPQLSQEEQTYLNNQVDTLCQMLNDWQVVYEEKNLPENIWEYLKKEKFLGMVIPKEYGGLGFSALGHSTVVTKIATRSISAAVNMMVPNSLGPAELLLHYGTDEQKAHYLPRLAVGKEIPCFALTAPEAGSDAGSMPDTGVVCRGQFEGKEVIGIKMNWDKRYITLAPIATVLGLAFKLYDPEHLLGSKDDIGITLALLPTSHPGVEIGNRHYPLQQAFLNGPTRGKDVFIPLDWIIGGEKMAGQGWRMLMECLSIGRSISLPALATACGKITYRYTGAYARLRRQFNTPIAAFEGIEEALGDIAGYTYQLEAARLMTAGAVDLKVKPSIASAIVKYHMTEISRTVVNRAMDVHAGHMIQVGPRNFLANLHFAMPMTITVEGANILTRNLIIFGQGAIRCHPYILEEVALISEPDPDIKALDKVMMSHIGYFVSNFVRSLGYGLSGGKLIFANTGNSRINKYQRQLTRMSTALALLSDTSLILLGGSLKRRERLSARLGDILSQLYLASTVLKYYKDNNKPASDVDYVCWSLQQCLYKIQVAADELLDNFPHRFVATILSWVIFPFGRAYRPPRDALHKKIVKTMLTPSELRDRITAYCFTPKSTSELGFHLDEALTQVQSADPIYKKLTQAVKAGTIPFKYKFADRLHDARQSGVLSQEDVDTVSQFEVLREEIIKVNEFSFDLKQVIV